LAGGAGEIDQHVAGIDEIDLEALGFQPAGDVGDIGLRDAEAPAEFLRRQPVMIVGGGPVGQRADVILDRPLLRSGALELKVNMFERHAVGHRLTIRGGHLGLGPGIALERHHPPLVNRGRQQRPAGDSLLGTRGDTAQHQCADHEG
jgi:hypothetical protein